MAKELHTGNLAIEQRPPVNIDDDERPEEIVLVDPAMIQKDYLAALKMAGEPMTIRIERSAEKNAARHIPVWINGKGAEVFQRGQWQEVTWLPVGRPIIVKRSVVEILARAKTDTIETEYDEEPGAKNPHNMAHRVTSALCTFSVLEDRNPAGHAWLTEMHSRYF